MSRKKRSKAELAAERNKALAEAHQKYVAGMEAARKEYVAAKRRIFPELARPTPEQQAKTIRQLRQEVKRLKEKAK